MISQTDRAQLRQLAFSVAETQSAPTWAIIRAIEIETVFDPSLVSSTGCVGLCQIDPTLCGKPGFGIPPCDDPMDPHKAVMYMCGYWAAVRNYYAYVTWGNPCMLYNVGPRGIVSNAAPPYRALGAFLNHLSGE
jgi:hypothetical protein